MIHVSRFLAASCTVFCLACSDSTPPPAPASKKMAPAAPAAPVQSPAPVWPGQGKGTSLAANPLAKNYYLVFDASGSMSDRSCGGNDTKLRAAKNALSAFAKSIPADANVGLLVFGAGGIRQALPLADTSRDRLAGEVASIRAADGTPLKTSIQRAAQALTEQGRRQLGYGEYHLVVITDGEHTPESENPRQVVEEILTGSPIIIHTLGFCLGEKHSLNQAGRILYKAANSQQDLERGLDAVLAESPAFDVKQFK
jgi:Ca-activated chloride channel family protein